MRPDNLKTKIFLYSGLSSETKEALDLLGFLDGQTTNIKLISKSSEIQKYLSFGKKYTIQDFFELYKKYVQEMASIIPEGLISVNIYSNQNTKADEMLKQAQEIYPWIKNTIIKFPINHEGLMALEKAVKIGIRVTMNHCYSQEQAAAVYAASAGAQKGQVFISPRIERIDYSGINGMDLVKNIIEAYKQGDGHVGVLSTDIGTIDHFLYSLSLGVDVVTTPLRILKVWNDKGMPVPQGNYNYIAEDLHPLEYYEIDLNKNWQEYDTSHELTEMSSQESFSTWRSLIG